VLVKVYLLAEELRGAKGLRFKVQSAVLGTGRELTTAAVMQVVPPMV
jgi:hypothetical protein